MFNDPDPAIVSAKTSSRQDLQANRFRLLGRLADDLAHEIRNPLHAMIINLEVLRKRIGQADHVALERAAVIEQEIHRVHELIDNLLGLLRTDSGGLRAFELDHLLGELVPLLELQTRLARVEFRYQPCTVSAALRAHRLDLKFAVLNLTEPLVDVLRPTGGTLVLSADCAPNEIRIRTAALRPPDGAREPRGTDEGIPNTPDRLEAARALAAELVRESGGRVEREDREGAAPVGEFIVVLPRLIAA